MAKGYPPEFRRRVLDLLAAGGASQRSPETLASATRRSTTGASRTGSIGVLSRD